MYILKQLLFIFLIGLPSLLFAQDSVQYNLLWRIEGNNLQEPSYLFGTMHVNDARAFNFSDSVMLALERCEYFALEVHPDTMMSSMFQELFDQEKENNLMDVLSEQEYQELKKKFEANSNLNLDEVNIQSPSMLSSMMEPDEDKADDKATFVDAYLFGIARTLNKSIWGLESMKDHQDAFSNYSKDQQREFLLGLIHEDYQEDYQQMLDEFVEVYKEGNITKIGSMANVFTNTDSQLIYRNVVMANSMENLMQEHALFAAVGTAHLPGENGIINLLIQKGYRVTPVTATFTGIATQYSIDYDKMTWHTQIDSNLGFAIDFPGQPTPIDLFDNLNTLMYVDLTNEVFLAAYSIDMRGREDQDEKELIERTIDGYVNSSDYQLLERKELTLNGIQRTDVIVKQDSSKQLRIQFMYWNDILYYFMIGNDAQQIRGSYANRYFESLSLFLPKQRVDTGWHFSYLKEAAISLAFPSKPSYQTEKSASKTNAYPYIYHNYAANDYGLKTSYALRYFDQPAGYSRSNNKDNVFTFVAQNFQDRNVSIRKIDTIVHQGIQGRAYDLVFEEKYYIRCKVFLRGARTYYLFHQNLIENDSNIQEDAFFKSFSFTAYQTPTFTPFVATDSSFSIDFFAKPRIEKDTFNSYFLNRANYYDVNPNSGMLCNLQVSNLHNYLKINNLDSFYHSIYNKAYQDSLINSQNIKIGTVQGVEFIIKQKFQDRIIRKRIWLDQQKLYRAQVYIDDDSIYNSAANHFLNSFRSLKPTNSFDPFSSKLDQLLKDLQAKDSLTRHQANVALGFYEFDTSNVEAILSALSIPYPKDSLTVAQLVRSLQNIADDKVIPELVDLYQSATTNMATRVAILQTVPLLDSIKGIDAYIRLLQIPSLASKEYRYAVFKLLYQYKTTFKSNYKRLLALAKHEHYRPFIIGFSAHLAHYDSSFANTIEEYVPIWLPYFNVDLEKYESTSKKDISLIVEYLHFFSVSKDKAFLDRLTKKILDQDLGPRIKTRTILVRFQAKLDPYWSKKTYHQLIKKPSYRPYLLPILFEYNYQNLIPRSYKYPPRVAKYLFYDYIRDEDTIDFVKELGKIKTKEGLFFVYEYRFLEDETSFVGISGPFVLGKPIHDYNYYSSTYTEHSALSKDWKKDGLLLIKNFNALNKSYWEQYK